MALSGRSQTFHDVCFLTSRIVYLYRKQYTLFNLPGYTLSLNTSNIIIGDVGNKYYSASCLYEGENSVFKKRFPNNSTVLRQSHIDNLDEGYYSDLESKTSTKSHCLAPY